MDLHERDTFSRFGKYFQENLVQIILEERGFCDQMQEVLDVNFLELKHLQVVVEKIFNYRDKYGIHPSYRTMGTIIRTELGENSELTKKSVRDYFSRISSGSEPIEDSDYTKEIALDFCKKQYQ